MIFPDWCPSPLREAYLTLEAESSEQWVRADELQLGMAKFSNRFEMSSSDVLRGIGDRTTTLQVIERLGADLRMKSVWLKLSVLESDAHEGRIRKVLELEEAVCCGVAIRCAYSMSDEGEVVTLASWKARHEAVARAATKLSELLKPREALDRALQNIALMFTEKQMRDVADELNGYVRVYSDSELRERPRVSQSEEEIRADNEKWEMEVKDLAYWVKQAMTRTPVVRSQDVLNRMAELAKFAAGRPPFLPRSSLPDRQIFMMSGSLFAYFKHYLGRPLDDVVATISSVVVGEDVSPESVKMRRQRQRRRQHQQRG